MYTRVHPREAGGLELALANIVVVDAWRGHGFLTLLLERMLHQDCGLISHWLRLERVSDPRLVRRLLTTGFLVDSTSDTQAPHLVAPLPAPAGG
jgi:hypothetical protein